MHSVLSSDLILPHFLLNYSVTIGLLAILLFCLWKYWTVTRPYVDLPTGHAVLKFLTAIFKSNPKNLPISAFAFQTFISVLERFQKEGICVVWLLQPLVFVFGEESVKIFSNELDAVNKSHHYEVLQDGFGTGLVTSNGGTWKKHRKMLLPVFHVGMLRSKMEIFNENSEIMVKKLSQAVNETSINILKYIKPCSINILLQFTMGLKMDDIENKKEISNFIQIIDDIEIGIVVSAKKIFRLSRLTAFRFYNPLLRRKFMLNFIPSGRQYIKMYDEANGFVKKLIEGMRKTVISRNSTGDSRETLESEKQAQKSFAHILLDLHMKDPSFTMYDLESEVMTFVASGYDTISHAMMWTLYLLGLDSVVQDRVYGELEEFIGDGPVQYEDIQRLKYMECVIMESLRLFPPVPVYARRTDADIQCGKYKVPKESTVIFCPYMLHRNPNIYPNPEKFDPERFAEGNFENRSRMHIPFSEGIRNCIGKRFAILELKVMLAHVLRNFRITSLDRREDLVLCFECVLIPSKPLRMKLSPRKRCRENEFVLCVDKPFVIEERGK